MADSLSQKMVAGVEMVICKSLLNCVSHSTLLVVVARALYSASVDDREMIICFFVFHETKAFPRKTQKPVTDFCVSAHAAQSASEKALSWMGEEAGKNNPWSGLVFI